MDLAHLPLAALDFSTLPEQIVNGLLLGAIYALIALGYTMVYGVLKLINFAHGEVYMIGAYVALLTSYTMGYTQEALMSKTPGPLLGSGPISMLSIAAIVIGLIGIAASFKLVRFKQLFRMTGGLFLVLGALGLLIAKFQPLALNLVIMLFASMLVCSLLGMVIERFAYRPMRGHSRIASLITAIGVSLFLQYGGALFLPNSPPASISEQVNPLRSSFPVYLVSPPAEIVAKIAQTKPAFESAQAEFDAYLQQTGESKYNVSEAGRPLRDKLANAQREYENAERNADTSGVKIRFQWGRVVMFATVIILMAALTYLVLFTPSGRAMRAVSHDFDSASLMGIDVNRIVTFTFVIGSSLAGAGAMMTATFQGTPLTTFYGLLPGVKAFVAAVLGGIGNIPGAVLGGFLMGVAENLVIWAGYSEYKDSIAFVILIAVLLFRPGGILGSSKVEKV
jgi:branched-chain amino acid transport system permease protein